MFTKEGWFKTREDEPLIVHERRNTKRRTTDRSAEEVFDTKLLVVLICSGLFWSITIGLYIFQG